jgi:hypothetical protein
MLLPFRARESKVLKVYIQFRITVHVEDALIGASRHRGDVPCAGTVMSVESVKAALCSGEAEVADQSVGNTVGLKPSNRWVLCLHFPSIKKFESPYSQVRCLAVIAHETLLEKRCGWVRVGVGCIVSASQSQLTLRSDRGNCIVRRIEHSRLRKFKLPIPAAEALRHADAQEGLYIAIRIGLGWRREPLP